jgi:hypothetical protein
MFDVGKIRARRTELMAELERLDSLLGLLENFSAPAPSSKAVQVNMPQPAVVPIVTPVVEKARGFTPGLRRAMTMALYTGPLSLDNLAKALAWDKARTKAVVGIMLKFKIAFLNEHGKLALGEEGKVQADWFLRNPGKLVYSPNGRGRKGLA